MPDPTPSLARTVEEATREAMASLTGTGEPEAPATEPAPAAAAPEAAQPGVETTTSEAQTSQEPEAPTVQASEEDTPTEWFGVDLTGIPAEKRVEIIDSFKERDKVINRLFQERSTVTPPETEGERSPTPAPQPVTEPAQPEPISDAEILAQLGIKEDDPLADMKAEIALPLARAIITQQEMVNEMAQERQLQSALDQWNTEMSSLADQFGALPEGVSQEDVLDFALQNNLTTPAETYFKMMGPLRKEVSTLARTAREAVKAKQGTGTRPRTSTETAPGPLTGKVKDVFAEAARQAANESGTSWLQAAKDSGWSGSELEGDFE